MCEQFGEILYEAGYYGVAEVAEGKLYTATHAQAERREKWSRVIFHVKRMDDGQEFDCECGQYAHMGNIALPCLKGNFMAGILCFSFPKLFVLRFHVLLDVSGDGLHAREGYPGFVQQLSRSKSSDKEHGCRET